MLRLQQQQDFKSFVSSQNSKSIEVNIMLRTTVDRMKLLSSDVYD
jgi:hypothetical protein